MGGVTPVEVRTGTKYRFIYTIDDGVTYYQSTGRVLSYRNRVFTLDLRPVASTAYLRDDTVKRIDPVPSDAQPVANNRWLGPT